MPERHTESTDYRYAYNGMEKDDEVSGNGNSYTTEFRQYDPRLLRWKSLDPLMHQFPWMSPYVAFNDNPIFYTDPLGLEGKPVTERPTKVWKVGDTCLDEQGNNIRYTGNGEWEGAGEARERRQLNNYDGFTRAWNFLAGNRHKNEAKGYASKYGVHIQDVLGGDAYLVAGGNVPEPKLFVRAALADEGISIDEIKIMSLNEFYLEQFEKIFSNGLLSLNLGESNDEIYLDGVPYILQANYTVEIRPTLARFRLSFKTGTRNAVYARMRNGLPYIGKSFNTIKRYSSFERFNSGMKTIISGINDSKLLRAVEQRMMDYLKDKGLKIDNKRRAMNLNDYTKYKGKVDELLKDLDWKGYLDDIFK